MRYPRLARFAALALLLAGCQAPLLSRPSPTLTRYIEATTPTPRSAATARPVAAQPTAAADTSTTLITGDLAYTNDFVFTYYVENAVALVDLHGFVTRDEDWPIPVEGQTLGPMTRASADAPWGYRLALPARPEGRAHDFGAADSQSDTVQVFAVAWWPNAAGGPYSEGDDRSTGWPTYLTSMTVDQVSREITGGALVIYAPTAGQRFPSGFGDDGKLFTADDPLQDLPAGFAVVNLSAAPFAISQRQSEQLTLTEPPDVAIKDLSRLSYSAAFAQMVATLRKEYAFNGIAGKEPDWDGLLARIGPKVAAAERSRDAVAYYRALQEFSTSFRDGHVDIDGGAVGQQVDGERLRYGYGLAIRELSDGRVIVVYVTPNSAASKAGVVVGDAVTALNDAPISDAIGAVTPPLSFSTEHSRRYQQARYLLRAQRAGERITVGLGSGKSAALVATEESSSFYATSLYIGYDRDALPLTFRTLPSGVGYIKLNSNYDDLNLLLRLYERALKQFSDDSAPGIVLDLRLNGGGSPLGLATYLTDREIPTGQDEGYDEKTGKFEPRGTPDVLKPSASQFRFKQVVVLVGLGCSSACEYEAYAFSQVPGARVVGYYPTNGIFADVARGQYTLPEGMSAQFSAVRTRLQDGTLLIEGKGVVPTDVVPVTAEGLLSGEDVELSAAEKIASQ